MTESADGVFEREIYTVPVNFQTSDGDWHEIDNSLVSTDRTGFAAENAAGPVDVLIPQDAGTGAVRVEGADDTWLSLRAIGADGSPDIDDTTATYDGPTAGTEVIYEVGPTGVKETIEVTERPATPASFSYALKLSAGLTPTVESGGDVEIGSSTGEVAYGIPAPFMYDASGADTGISREITTSLVPTDQGWTLRVTPDAAWLNDPARVYPVTIDPTVVFNPADADCWLNAAAPTSQFCTSESDYIKVGLDSNGKRRRGLLRFNIGSVPGDANISSANLHLYLDPAQTLTTHADEYVARRATRSWTEAATWNTSNGSTQWTTPGGDFASGSTPGVVLSGQTGGYRAFDVTDMSRAWKSGQEPNNGIVVKQKDENGANAVGFYSSDSGSTNASKWPKLVVTYTQPTNEPGALTVAPCVPAPCDMDYQFTDTVTPTLKATATDGDTSTLTYTWEIRPEDNGEGVPGAVIATGTSTAPSGTAASWQVPTGKLNNEVTYEFRVAASDGATTAWSTWEFFGVDIDEQPAVPTAMTLSPCTDPCAPLVSTSVQPVLTADVDDPDTTLVDATFEVRATGTTTVIATSTTQVLSGGPLTYAVPSSKLTDAGSYEFRVRVDDGTTTIDGPWTGFTVDVPTGPAEPELPMVANTPPCGTCLAPTAATDTPTIQATQDPGNSPTVDLKFQVQGTDGVIIADGTATDVAPGDSDSWAVPDGVLASGLYKLRAGASDGTTTTWTAWHNFLVNIPPNQETDEPAIPGAEPDPDAENGVYDPNWTPDPALNSEDAGAVVPQVDETGPTAATEPIWVRYAPRLFLHRGDDRWPMSATTFINNSDLEWSHNNCTDHELGGSILAGTLGDGDYTHREKHGAPFCSHDERYHSTDRVRPFLPGDPGGSSNEGMLLNMWNGMRDGDGFRGDEPVYVYYVPNRILHYFFLYGSSSTWGFVHEGDWEHVAIKLKANDVPDKVQYFWHKTGSCTLRFQWAPKLYGHIGVWVGENTHGSYPPGGDTDSGDTISNDILWRTSLNVDPVGSRPWYGYAGGWGEAKDFARLSGPWGPNPHRDMYPSFATDRCEFD